MLTYLADPRHSQSGALLEVLSATLVRGPVPAVNALAKVEELLPESPTRAAEAHLLIAKGCLLALLGCFDEARLELRSGVDTLSEMAPVVAETYRGIALGHLELLAADDRAAIEVMTGSFDHLSALGERGFSSTIAAQLAVAYAREGELDRAHHFARLADSRAVLGDYSTQVYVSIARALVARARGRVDEAMAEARQAVALSEPTDDLEQKAHARIISAQVLVAAADPAGARTRLREARRFAVAKGAVAYIAQIDAHLTELAKELVPA
jgi:ATP/maltotriose-dependent transcriptional regulator MalT